MIWIVLGCCWVSQIRTKPTKNIWGPLLDSISSYYVQCPWKIVSFFQVFRHLNYHILVFFPAYIGLYWTPAGWYGQKPYLGPAHMWLRQNMAVCDAELGPKWGGVTNTRFTFLASYLIKFHWNVFMLQWNTLGQPCLLTEKRFYIPGLCGRGKKPSGYILDTLKIHPDMETKTSKNR